MIKKFLHFFIFFFIFVALIFSQNTRLNSVFYFICTNSFFYLPIISLILVIGAGLIYASGQIFGADTKAKATSWATAMIIGAFVGFLLIFLLPPIIAIAYGLEMDILNPISICSYWE
jgi:hypothetical protein